MMIAYCGTRCIGTILKVCSAYTRASLLLEVTSAELNPPAVIVNTPEALVASTPNLSLFSASNT